MLWYNYYTMPLNDLRKIKDIVTIQHLALTPTILAKVKGKGRDVQEVLTTNEGIDAYKIVYYSNGHKISGFIVEPQKGENLPCIIRNRGGSGDFALMDETAPFTHLARIASWGYVVFASQYPGNSESEGTDEYGGTDLSSVLTLYEVIKQYKKANSTRIGMYGISRGGMMTYLSLAKVAWIKAAVISSAPTNLFRSEEFQPRIREVFIARFGGSDKEKKKRSALFWADKFLPTVPLLLLHGLSDSRVSPLDAIEMSAKLYLSKIPHRLVMFEGADHYLTEVKKESSLLIKMWFDRYVRESSPLPDTEPHGK